MGSSLFPPVKGLSLFGNMYFQHLTLFCTVGVITDFEFPADPAKPVFIHDLYCSRNESSIWECPHNILPQNLTFDDQNAAVLCQGDKICVMVPLCSALCCPNLLIRALTHLADLLLISHIIFASQHTSFFTYFLHQTHTEHIFECMTLFPICLFYFQWSLSCHLLLTTKINEGSAWMFLGSS